MSANSSPSEGEALAQRLAEQYQACYEVWPVWTIRAGKRVQIGFEVDVEGVAPRPEHGPQARVYGDVRSIAAAALPDAAPDASVVLLPFDHALHASPRRAFRPEVEATAQIVPAHGCEQPVDRAEESCLRKIELALRRLGVRRAN